MSKNDFQLSSTEEGKRLDRALQTITGLSRKKVKALLDQGRVLVNGRKVVIASWVMKRGDHISLVSEGDSTSTDAQKYFLKVVFEDPDLLVVEKDAGISCEASPVATKPSMVAIMNVYLKRRGPHLKRHYLGLVHRLDRDTSGLMIYTKTKEGNRITDQFKGHRIKRRYLAVVEGRVESNAEEIKGFLKKSELLPRGQKVAISTPASGRFAAMRFRVLERYANASLTELTLNTGRTHQIRVQMASVGHPVVGDRIYGKSSGAIPFVRQALHASFLGFHHPISGQKMEFSSELPRDMRRLVDQLRLRS